MHVMFRRLTRPGRAILLACLLAAPCLFTPGLQPLLAQSATAGAIGGTVTDAGGALLPGTVVTIRSKDSGVTRTTKTNSQGEYRLSELEPGTYTVTYAADGFDTAQQDNVAVTIGSLANVSPKLTVGSVTSKVEVSDEAPLLHTESSEISTTIDQDRIDNLPINGRRWSSFALLTPGVVSNADGFGLLSFRGISYLLNNSTVDGADNNQAYFSEERGRTRASYSISQAAVQEFQVNTSNYSAEYGRAAGGVINTVTKSGSNQFHGELFFYDRDNQWGAENPYTQLIQQVPGSNTFTAVNYKPKDWRKQWGFGVGGYILRDKLFWFYSYDQSRRNFPGTGRASDVSDTFAPADTTLPAGTTCTGGTFSGVQEGDGFACSLANALKLGNGAAAYQAGAAYYTQGLGIIASELGYVPRFSDQVLNFPRIDYQINDRNRLTVEYNRLRYTAPAGFQTQATNFYGRASFGDDYVKDDFGILRFTSVLGNSLINEFRAQYGRDFEYTLPQPSLPNEVPLANNQFGLSPSIQIGYEFDLQGFNIGPYYGGIRNAYPDERRTQGEDIMTWSHARHTTKWGADINRVYDRTNNLYEGQGSFSYDYQWDFIADYLHQTTGLGGTAYTDQFYSETQGFGNPSISIATTDWNAFISDDWRITPTLTLTAGLRYEYEYIPPNPYVNNGNPYLATLFGGPAASPTANALPQTAYRPDDRNNFGPRVGFAWNVYGNGKTTLRGGYGMFYGRVINAYIGLAYQNSGSPKGQVPLEVYGAASSTHAGCTNLFPQLMPSSESALAAQFLGATPYGCSSSTPFNTPTVGYLDKHLQNPEVHEADLSLQQDLGWGTVFEMTYMVSVGHELPSVYDTNTVLSPSNITYTVRNDLSYGSTKYGNVTGLVLPHGGKPAPLQQGGSYTFPYYNGARQNANYYAIYAEQSEVNSNYNALAFQVNKRFSNSLSLLSSFTWAKAMDQNPFLSTSYTGTSYLPVDPTNRAQDYGRSSLNVGQRFVLAAHYAPVFDVHGWKRYVLNDWNLAPIVQAQTGLPYSAGTSGGTGATLAGPLGAGGAARLPKYDIHGNFVSERNIYDQPKTADLDVRLGKSMGFSPLHENLRLEVFAELFNALNHQNITSVNSGAYGLCATTTATGCTSGFTIPPVQAGNYAGVLEFNQGFGTYNNANSNTIYSPRQLQLAARLHF